MKDAAQPSHFPSEKTEAGEGHGLPKETGLVDHTLCTLKPEPLNCCGRTLPSMLCCLLSNVRL